jgi:hypothetical protein
VAVRQALEHADIISERREGEAPNGATADMLVVLAAAYRRLQAAQPPAPQSREGVYDHDPSSGYCPCNAAREACSFPKCRAAQPVAPQEPVDFAPMSVLAKQCSDGHFEREMVPLADLRKLGSLYLAPTPQGDSGQRDRLVAAISGKVYTKAFREEVLALFDASLPPDLGAGERRG